ncbi:hypothetical protein COB21_00365 [Candidatus Aerophobetes bacterium]|uniref:Uncharacterized protein n=1 Tax=Aerophobetes bacterium TaxID=2030807 RepID=A0A2A4X7V1_UNCAE|nr:MAG: hypothetical protein COB21_00365 [Candidatus Aerophobetes bacterium]
MSSNMSMLGSITAGVKTFFTETVGKSVTKEAATNVMKAVAGSSAFKPVVAALVAGSAVIAGRTYQVRSQARAEAKEEARVNQGKQDNLSYKTQVAEINAAAAAATEANTPTPVVKETGLRSDREERMTLTHLNNLLSDAIKAGGESTELTTYCNQLSTYNKQIEGSGFKFVEESGTVVRKENVTHGAHIKTAPIAGGNTAAARRADSKTQAETRIAAIDVAMNDLRIQKLDSTTTKSMFSLQGSPDFNAQLDALGKEKKMLETTFVN